MIERHAQYVESAGSHEKALYLARQLRWLVERFGGWDELLQALQVSSRIRMIAEGTAIRDPNENTFST